MSQSFVTFSAITRKSLADVTRRRLRTLLVVLGIAIGVLGLTAINVASDAMRASIAYSDNKSAAPDITFSVQAVDPSLASTLAAVPGVKTVQIDTVYSTRWHISTGHVNTYIVAYANFNAVKLNTFELTSGRLPGAGEIAMESSDRGLQKFAVGDTVTIETPHGLQSLRVVGLVRTPGLPGASFLSFATGYMSADGLAQLTGLHSANDIEVQVKNPSQVNTTARQLSGVLHNNHVVVLSASTQGPNIDQIASDALFSIMRVLAIIALLLTGFLIINTVTTLITEQMKVIGTMKAIGGTRQSIIRSYLLSIAMYGVLGTALGLSLGIIFGYQILLFLSNLFTLDLGSFQVSASVILVSIAVGTGVPFVAAIIPLWTGTKITAHQAMSTYGMSNAQPGKSRHTLVSHLTWIPQTAWLGMRGIFRKRSRAVLTLLALTLSGTAFLSVQVTTYSFDQFLNKLLDTYHLNAQVSTNPQPYDHVKALMKTVPNVGQIERFEILNVKTHQAPFDLTGIEYNTHMYHYQLLAGRWFHGDEPNVLIISDVVAGKLHMKVGDKVVFSDATATATWTVIGEVSDQSDALDGGTALTTIDDLHAFEGLPTNLARGFMIQAVDPSPSAVDHMANALDDTLSRAGLAPSIRTNQQIVASNQTQFQLVSAILYAVSAIIALVGILGLFNTLAISVLERRREIGILRSMGATGWKVARVFWIEGISLATFAWIVAVIIGIPCAYVFIGLISAVLVPVPFSFSPLSLATMLVLILAIATLACLGPAFTAARLRVSDILRYE